MLARKIKCPSRSFDETSTSIKQIVTLRGQSTFECSPIKVSKKILPKLNRRHNGPNSSNANEQRSAFMNQSRIVAVKRRRLKLIGSSGRNVGSQSVGLFRARSTILRLDKTRDFQYAQLEMAQSFSYATLRPTLSPIKCRVPKAGKSSCTIVAKVPRPKVCLIKQNSVILEC